MAHLTEAQRHAVAAAVLAAAAAAISQENRYNPEPYHDSEYTGRQWVEDLISGHPQRMKNALGVESHVFRELCHQLFLISGLADSRDVDLEEKVAMFLYLGVHNNGHHDIAKRFQRSTATVSGYVGVFLLNHHSQSSQCHQQCTGRNCKLSLPSHSHPPP